MERLSSLPAVLPNSDIIPVGREDRGWKVTVFNNETNTYVEVMTILMLATGCDEEEAYIETWEVDHYGQCVVHRASQAECEQVRKVISTIGIGVEAEPEDD